MTEFDGLRVTPPEGFALVDAQAVFRSAPAAPSGPTLAKARALSPNLIVQRRRGVDVGSPEAYAERARQDLAALAHLSEVESRAFAFADEYPGTLLAYSFTIPSGIRVRQLQAIRLDDGVVTVATLTVADTRTYRDRESEFFASLASIIPL